MGVEFPKSLRMTLNEEAVGLEAFTKKGLSWKDRTEVGSAKPFIFTQSTGVPLAQHVNSGPCHVDCWWCTTPKVASTVLSSLRNPEKHEWGCEHLAEGHSTPPHWGEQCGRRGLRPRGKIQSQVRGAIVSLISWSQRFGKARLLNKCLSTQRNIHLYQSLTKNRWSGGSEAKELRL